MLEIKILGANFYLNTNCLMLLRQIAQTVNSGNSLILAVIIILV